MKNPTFSKLIFCAGFCIYLSAQTSPSSTNVQPPQTNSGTTIKVTTQLVLVNVLVHDRHGDPIADLSKTDFELKDAGKAQKISVFAVDQLSPSSSAGNAVASLPRNVTSNRPVSHTGGTTSATVVLFDTYNTKLTDQAYANAQLKKFLRTVRPEDRVAIYTLNARGFGIVHDFTNNAAALEAALSKTRPTFSHELDASNTEPASTGNDDLDATIDASNTIVSNFASRNRVLNTCSAFKALADHLSGIPGRKNLIWLTGSVPISIGFGDPEDIRQAKQKAGGAAAEQEQFEPYIQEATQALNTANVAVYPVDARGLLLPSFVQASTKGGFDPTKPPKQSMLTVDNRNPETMDVVAEQTGGKAFHNTNDLAGAVRKAMDDSAVTYTLGYYVTEEDWDNKFHSIKVSVNRPGAKVRTKKGYLALEKPAPTSAQLDAVLRTAVWSPLDSTILSIATRIDSSLTKPHASRLLFALDPNELQFKLADNKYRTELDILLVQEKKQGVRLTDQKKTLRIGLLPDQFKNVTTNGLSLSDDLSIDPQTVAVRIIVLDRSTGNIGSVTIPITAADKSAETLAPAPAGMAPQP